MNQKCQWSRQASLKEIVASKSFAALILCSYSDPEISGMGHIDAGILPINDILYIGTMYGYFCENCFR
jgi:hypothetical protein